MNNSLSSSEKIEKSNLNYVSLESAVKILNPLSNELNILRQSMIDGGLSVIQFNQNRQNPDLKLFELGKVYHLHENGYAESKKLAVFLTGKRYTETWTSPNQKSTYFAIKATALKIMERLGLIQNLKADIKLNKALEDGVLYTFNQTPVCEIGWIDSKLLKDNGIKQQVFYAEFDWDNLMKAVAKSKTEFKVIPKTQFVRRDFSLLLDEKVSFEAIKKTAQNSTKKILKEVGLFDVYEGKNLAPGKKSYAVSFTFQDDEKTLQDDQVDKMMSVIREKLESELGAELR
jgi:phenylalanyl-tRNA synthetase beta chain